MLLSKHHRYSSAFRIIGVTLFAVACFWMYGRTHFHRDPGSIFFDPTRAFDRSYSLYREAEANAFAAATSNQQNSSAVSGHVQINSSINPSPIICASVISAARGSAGGAHPLKSALSSALAGMSEYERGDLDLRVYIANVHPEMHPLWNSSLIRLANRTIWAGDFASDTQLRELEHLENEKQYAHKAVLDFALALQDCHETSQAPYIALFEGDVLFADGWMARTRLGLEDIARSSSEGSWLDMRLFNEERSIGWASNRLLGNNVPYIICGISGTLLAAVYILRRKFGHIILADQTILTLACFTVPVVVIMFFQAGKASMIPISHGVARQDWGCCSQGLVFARQEISGLIEELRRRAGQTSADIVIEDYAKDLHKARYVLNPVQLQHLGFESIISPDRPREHSVWSMAFEHLTPAKLRNDHMRMLAQLYHHEQSN